MNTTTALPAASVRFHDGWLARRVRVVRDVMLPYQWEALNDRVPDAEPSGCIQNARTAAGLEERPFVGLFWQDSDLAKWLEAASFSLARHPDSVLEARVDEVVALLAKAQQGDGYLNTYFQLVEPEKRFTNLRDCHELYCAGHLIEAAVAHAGATGKDTLLAVARKLADLLVVTFGEGEGRIRGYDGHEEIELALVKLGRATGDARYIDLAAWFIEERGRQPSFFKAEARQRAEEKEPWYTHFDGLAYWQAHVQPREQREPVGHAVRAMYLYSAMADLALERADEALATACRRLWNAIEERHLYLTGGIGADGPGGEKFGEPYDLPSDRAYAETCAAVGLVFFARRMLDLDLDGSIADTMERALYNNVLSGISLDGRSYFYVNPLEARPREAVRRYDCRHVKTTRQPWFACACCPPNVARLLSSLGDYAVSRQPAGLAIHLYEAGEIRCEIDGSALALEVATNYPWSGGVRLVVVSEQPVTATLRLRIPGWRREATVSIDGAPPLALSARGADDTEAIPPTETRHGDFSTRLEKGYLAVSGTWVRGNTIDLDLAMPVERVRAHPRVAALAGCVALQRGPVVYCFEEADNGPDLAAVSLPAGADLATHDAPELLEGCSVIEAQGQRVDAASWGNELYRQAAPAREPVNLRAIPYALWANRGEGEMRVWLRETI